MTTLSRCSYILVLAAAAAVAGCGPRVIFVQGRVIQGGKPIELAKGETVEVAFVPIEQKKNQLGTVYGARTQRDGSFDVPGIYRKGIPSGRYQISVTVVPNRGSDRLGGKYSGANAIVREITSSGELVIDLDRPTE